MPKLDWIIEIIGNGVVCAKCGKVEDSFPEYICNAHTHGMKKYHHPDFQLVLHISDEDIGYILNSLGLRVRSGEQLKAGDLIEGIFEDCPVRLDSFEESGTIPPGFPEIEEHLVLSNALKKHKRYSFIR